MRNGEPAHVSQYAAVVNLLFTLGSPSCYLNPITFLEVQNVRIAQQGSPFPARTEYPWKGYTL